MEENKIILTGLCPYCAATLDYAEDKAAVVCHSCGSALPVNMLRLAANASDSASDTDADRSIAEGVTSASAGLIYTDNFCREFDWAEFAATVSLTIPRLDAISESCKIKFSSDPVTYILDFRRLALPILKKIEGLSVLEHEIVTNYKNDDISDLFEYFDIYSAITNAVVAERNGIYKQLHNDIMLAKKFGADERVIKDLEESLDVFEARTASVTAVNDISEIEAYKRAKDAKDAVVAAKYRAAGIDAEGTYVRAHEFLDMCEVDKALNLLHAISEYKDAYDLIADHSGIFNFDDELIEMAGKRYVIKNSRPVYFDVTNPERTNAPTRALFEIVNGAPAEEPALTQISELIGSYGTRIFFIRNDSSICCYDTSDPALYANVRVLDEAPVGDYVADSKHPVLFSADRSKFFIRKKIRDGKRGCFGKKKNKVNRQNNYSIILVDMDRTSVSTILPAVVDIMDFYGDSIFYTTLDENGGASFRICNINTLADDAILNAECVIHNVADGRIIYSVWAPNMYNMDLYSIAIDSKESVLLDKNIASYYTTYAGKVFYTVGVAPHSRLYSIDYCGGSDPVEIMSNAGKVCALRSGWIYYVSGEGRNACLMKVSTDGQKIVRVASRFDRLVKMTNGYVYYVNTRDELRVVRCDGNDDRRIIDSIAKERIIIDESNIFCLRYENIGADGTPDGYSLYAIGNNGKGLRKLVHGVNAIKEYDDDTLYLCSKKSADFVVTVPKGQKGSTSHNVTREVTTYRSINMTTRELEDIAVIGIPDIPKTLYRSGCFKTTKSKLGSVVEVSQRPVYRRTGVSKAGEVLEEENRITRELEETKRREKEEKRLAKQKKKQEKREAKLAKKQEKLAKKQAKLTQ